MAIQLSGFKSIAAFGAATLEMIAIDFDGVKLGDYLVMRFVTASSAYQAQLFLNGLMMYLRHINQGIEVRSGFGKYFSICGKRSWFRLARKIMPRDSKSWPQP